MQSGYCAKKNAITNIILLYNNLSNIILQKFDLILWMNVHLMDSYYKTALTLTRQLLEVVVIGLIIKARSRLKMQAKSFSNGAVDT